MTGTLARRTIPISGVALLERLGREIAAGPRDVVAVADIVGTIRTPTDYVSLSFGYTKLHAGFELLLAATYGPRSGRVWGAM